MKQLPFLFSVPVFLIATGFVSCKREFDVPPVKHISEGSTITISKIKSRFNANSAYRFSGDTNLYCVVIADEASGNLYKDIYIRDVSGAIHVKLKESGGLFTGDSIRINLNNVVLNNYADLIQLDSVDVASNVVKLASGLNPRPEEMSLEQVLDLSATTGIQSKLVKINDVQFSEAGRKQPFANAATKAALQYTLQDCDGRQIVLRTSGYSYFANRTTPSGQGSIIAIVSSYYSTLQLIIRDPNELNMNGTPCAAANPTSSPNPTNTPNSSFFLNKDFNDNNVVSGGWSTYDVTGSIHWSTSSKGGAPNSYCQISNYISSANLVCESWLISPPMSIASSTNPVLSFRNACNYTGPPLTLLVSTNYTAGIPSSATWSPLTFTASTGGFTFVNSGSISLRAFKSANTRFAFRYTGTSSAGATWEVDDIVVKEE